MAFIGDENAVERSRLSCNGKKRVMQGRLFKQTAPLDQRLEEQAKRLRKEARGTPHGVEREKLIRRARQAETAAHIQEWLSSPRPATTEIVSLSVCGNETPRQS